MRIEYALMVSDPQGVAINSSTWGIYNGAMAYVTGRPAWTTATPPTTAPLNPNSLTNQLDWKEGMFLMGKFSLPSYAVDMEEMGTYGTTSGMKVELQNVTGLFFALRDLGITLYRCRVQFFVVIDGVFIQWWEGSVNDVAFNGTTLSLDCVDYFKDIHKDAPPSKVDADDYPRAKDSVRGKVVPICMGYVTHARLLNVGGISDPLDCAEISGIKHKVCPIDSYTEISRTIVVYVNSLVVDANAWAGKWAIPVRGGPAMPRRIISNTASSANKVAIVLESLWTKENADEVIAPTLYHTTASLLNEWWIQIVDASFPRIVSDRPVASIEDSANGFSKTLETFDKDAEAWVDVSSSIHRSSAQAIDQGGGRPGFLLYSKDLETSKQKVEMRRLIRPTAANLVDIDWLYYGNPSPDAPGYAYGKNNNAAYLTASSVTANGSIPALRNLTNSPAVSWTLTRGSSISQSMYATRAIIDVFFDDSVLHTGYDSLSAHINLSMTASGAWKDNTEVRCKAGIYGIDIFNVITAKAGGLDLFLDVSGVSPSPPVIVINAIPLEYFSEWASYNSEEFYNQKTYLNFGKLISNREDLKAFKGIRIVLEFEIELGSASWFGGPPSNTAITFAVNEVAISGNGEMDFAPEEVATRVIGQMFSDDWDSRRTAGDPVTNIADIPEYFIREYDDRPALIDTASVDAVKALRPDATWSIGRQFYDDSKSSAEHIASACKEGWFAIVPTHTGQRRQIAWTEAAPDFDFDATNIVPGSIGTATATPLRKVYTEFDLNHNFDPGPNKRTRNIQIRRTEEAFPAETDFEGGSSTLPFVAYLYNDGNDPPSIQFEFTSEVLKVGDYISFVGTEPGHVLIFTPRRVFHTYYFEGSWFAHVDGAGGSVLVHYTEYTLGTLTVYESHAPAWKNFVSGVDNYSDAAALHNSVAYPLTRTKNVLKLDMDWGFDWSDWGGSTGNNMPLAWLGIGAPYLSTPKYRIGFKVPINADTLGLYPGRCITFTDDATNGDTVRGWIQRLNLRPGAKGKDNVIEVEIIYLLD